MTRAQAEAHVLETDEQISNAKSSIRRWRRKLRWLMETRKLAARIAR